MVPKDGRRLVGCLDRKLTYRTTQAPKEFRSEGKSMTENPPRPV